MIFNFKDAKEPIFTEDPYYDLFLGGYIKPGELLSDKKQAEQVEQAIDVVKSFLNQAESVGVIEIC